jgi:hypothetical protein
MADGLGIVGGVDDGGRFGEETGDVFAEGDAAEILVAEGEADEGAVDEAARVAALAHHAEDDGVELLAKILRLDEAADAVEGLRVVEDGAEKGLLGLERRWHVDEGAGVDGHAAFSGSCALRQRRKAAYSR